MRRLTATLREQQAEAAKHVADFVDSTAEERAADARDFDWGPMWDDDLEATQ